MDLLLAGGYILLSLITIVITIREWYRQRDELSTLKERVVRLETEVVRLRKPTSRVSTPPVQPAVEKVWRYSGRGW